MQAAHTGRTAEIAPLLSGLAAFRPAVAGPAELGRIPSPVLLSRGLAVPGIFCLPAPTGRPGGQEYAGFARGFNEIREVSVLRPPGLAAGEPLAATADALVAVHAENIRRSADGEPFVLAGHSSGGLVAHALATHLERAGCAPVAVVLIDTYPAGQDRPEGYQAMLRARMLAAIDMDAAAGNDSWLIATAHYSALDWSGLDQTALPTLHLRAQETAGGPPSWPLAGNLTVVDVPGNHFTIIEEHAETTARAVSEWLAGLKGR